ncbi:MAG: hypothetical protein ABSF22_22120, partial [Bryobacteraceae bacterium]
LASSSLSESSLLLEQIFDIGLFFLVFLEALKVASLLDGFSWFVLIFGRDPSRSSRSFSSPRCPNSVFFNDLAFSPARSQLLPLVYQGMATPAQIKINRTEINRANAQHSTGPKTEAGKKHSSLNALRHGLTGQVVVMPAEDLQAYQLHLKSFADEYHPQGATESHLVQALADTSWRLNRVAALESNLLSLAAIGDPLVDALGIAASLESQSKALSNLSMHSQRLSRQFERTVMQLRDLQKIRRAQENQDLSSLLDIMEMYESKGEAYRPSDDGFVFSDRQIEAAIRARNRENLASKAYEHGCDTAAE